MRIQGINTLKDTMRPATFLFYKTREKNILCKKEFIPPREHT